MPGVEQEFVIFCYKTKKPKKMGRNLTCCWESNPTNIESPVFWGNTAITLITQKIQRDPILQMFSLCLSDVGVWDSSIW